MKKIFKNIILGFLAFILIISSICIFYFSSYYEAVNNTYQSTDLYTIYINKEETWVKSNNNDTLIIMYPGCKVENEAYIPLAIELTKYGYSTVIIDPLLNFMLADTNAYKKYLKDYKSYYLMGHSLGGTVASMVVDENIDALILLASYSSKDISDLNINVLSITGELDGVLNLKKQEEAKINLPKNTIYKIIEGGNHSDFGDYGFQDGDNKSTLKENEQIEITAKLINDYMKTATTN
ncbi:MAG: alpha/beta hydrolase [Erysipelotrichaceae bacterium]|nr:alpha/beta hydrolase [Erysipelotrichaceae bacterium]